MKKTSLSAQELITRKTSVLLNVSDEIVSKVMSFEKKSVADALRKYSVVESSNLCVFKVRPKKVISEIDRCTKKRLELIKKLEQTEESGAIERILDKINELEATIAYLKTKQSEN